MSSTESSVPAPGPGGDARARRMAQLGISQLPNGHYTLPPVVIAHSNNQTQAINIEVGDVVRVPVQSSTASPQQDMADNQRVMYLQQFLRSFARPPAPTASVAPVAPVTPTEPAEATEAPAAAESTVEAPRPPSQGGVRGLDFPAFDVSPSGVYNDPSQPTGVLRPLEQILNSISQGAVRGRMQAPTGQTVSARSAVNTPSGTASALQNALGAGAGPIQESRNIILTVNYVYGGQQGPNASTTGSLILHVPSINETNQDNIEVLVRLATSIALRTISTTVKKSWGVSKSTFDNLATKRVADLGPSQRDCPICYDKFEDLEPAVEEGEDNGEDESEDSGKRKRESNEELPPAKKLKTAFGSATATASATPKDTKSAVVNPGDYSHHPVVLECGHVFGQSCLAEWFKSSNSCPLCRSKVPAMGGNVPTQTTISLPNLATVISNGREVIEDLNNRHLVISIPDRVPDAPQATPTAGEGQSAETSAEGVSTSAAAGQNPTNDPLADSDSDADPSDPSSGLDALAGILRDVYNSVAERFGAQRAHPLTLEPPPPIQGDVVDLNVNDTGLRASHPVARPAGFRVVRRINHNDGGMFPSGVASTRRGGRVETRELTQRDALDTHVVTSDSNAPNAVQDADAPSPPSTIDTANGAANSSDNSTANCTDNNTANTH